MSVRLAAREIATRLHREAQKLARPPLQLSAAFCRGPR